MVAWLADGVGHHGLMDPASGDSKLEHRTELQAVMRGRMGDRLPNGAAGKANWDGVQSLR